MITREDIVNRLKSSFPLRTLVALHSKGVMGLNERNIKYINAYNPRRLHQLVNNKIETKILAKRAGIPVPELYGSISNAREMRNLPTLINRADGFVIKPAQGAQGNGVMLIDRQLRGGWHLINGRRITLDEIKFHINNIMSGMYSLGGQQDAAMFEYRVKFDPLFENVLFRGVPDIRIIVLRGFPVAAMVRLPTADSDGKANLHKGGVGVGLDIPTGVTTTAMHFDRPISHHPDTAHPLAGIQIPHWTEILLMAAKSYDVTGLGYLGVDLVLDREKGPLLLELNARPGISIQIANRMGLKQQLEKLATTAPSGLSAEERVELACKIVLHLGEDARKDAA